MNIIKTPSTVHPAFNPTVFTLSDQFETPASYKASLSIVLNNKTIVLTRQYQRGAGTTYTASFDVSGIIKTQFATSSPETGVTAIDNRLFVRYKVSGVTYVALNAVAQYGSGTDWSNKQSLYYRDQHNVFPDYPRDITMLVLTDALGAEFKNTVVRQPIEQTPTDRDYLLGDVTITPRCVPDNPFYVRWLNRLGGIDYYMFGYDQEEKTTIKSPQNINLFNLDTEAATGSSRTFGITADRTIIVGTEGLSELEYKILCEIPTSPIIEWYNEQMGAWQTITANKAENTYNSRFEQQSFEIVFDLPELNLQFA